MSKDYYSILGIAQSATESQIRNAYLSMAKEWHPDLHNGADKELAKKKFSELREAFDVLSNPTRKESYDLYGDPDKIKEKPEDKPKEKPKKEPKKKKEDESDTNEKKPPEPPNIKLPPGMQVITPATLVSPFNRAVKSSIITRKVIPVKPKPKKLPVMCALECTLEELYYGCEKNAYWKSWDTECRDQRTTKIDVKPGWAAGHKIDYHDEEMDEEIMIIVIEAKHPVFKRKKDDLHYTATITLKQALCGGEIVVPTIVEGVNLKLQLQGLISPGQTKEIPKHGMTITGKPGMRGKLVVTFNIIFPIRLTNEQREKMAELL